MILLQVNNSFDYSYTWLIVLGVFVIFGVILPCAIRAYRRHKYGLSVLGDSRALADPYETQSREPTAAEVSRHALAQLNAQNITTQRSTVQPVERTDPTEYQFPTSNGYKLNQYVNETNTTINKTNYPTYAIPSETIPPGNQYSAIDIPSNTDTTPPPPAYTEATYNIRHN